MMTPQRDGQWQEHEQLWSGLRNPLSRSPSFDPVLPTPRLIELHSPARPSPASPSQTQTQTQTASTQEMSRSTTRVSRDLFGVSAMNVKRARHEENTNDSDKEEAMSLQSTKMDFTRSSDEEEQPLNVRSSFIDVISSNGDDTRDKLTQMGYSF